MSKPDQITSTSPEEGFEGLSWYEIMELTEPDPRGHEYGESISTIEEAREYAVKVLNY